MVRRAHCIVSGVVQGVGFRAHTRREALRLGLAGWVRNRADGSVELAAEGDEAAVQLLIGWARRGPSWARVDGVEVEWEPVVGERGFEVRHL